MTDELLSQSLSAAPAGGPADAARLDPDLAAAARALAARGAVLLRNNHDALPLDPAAPVAVLGRVQKDWIAVGYGSGGDVTPPRTSPTSWTPCGRRASPSTPPSPP